MKILQVIPYFCFGGAETMCENLTYALRGLGHTVAVVSLYGEKTPISLRMEQAGVKIYYLDKKPGLDVSMVGKLRKIMQAERPDAVHTHLDVIKYAALAAKISGVKRCVHTVHNVADQEAGGQLQKIVNGFYFRNGWSVPVALTELVKESICQFYGLDKGAVPVVYNGVDLRRCLEKNNYDCENPVIVHVGRFNEQKNHAGLLRAFSLILRKFPNSRLDLLGDGELRPDMENLAKELDILDHVRFLGSQGNVYPYLQGADVFVLPSCYEGMPMTIIEAMGTGLPVVASRVGGVPDMIESGVNGMLVPSPVQPETVAEAVCALLEDKTLREAMGREAKAASLRFSAQTMADSYCRLYER